MASKIQTSLEIRDDGTATINKVNGEMKKMQAVSTGVAGKVGAAFAKVKQNIVGISIAAVAAGLAIKKAFSSAQDFAQFTEDVTRVNAQLVEYGTNAQDLTARLVDATNKQLNWTKSIQISSRALRVGMNPDQIVTFTKVADVLSDTLGTDLSGSFDQLVNSVAKGNDRALKAAGIFLDMELRIDNYAKAMEKSTTQVSQQERSQIALNAIMEKSEEIITKYASATLSTADELNAMQAQMDNFVLQAKGMVIPTVMLVVGAFQTLVGQLATGAGFVIEWITVATDFFGVTTGASQSTQELTDSLKGFGQEQRNKAFEKLESSARGYSLAVDPLSAETASLTATTQDLANAQSTLAQTQGSAVATIDAQTRAIDDQAHAMSVLVSVIRILDKEQSKQAARTPVTPSVVASTQTSNPAGETVSFEGTQLRNLDTKFSPFGGGNLTGGGSLEQFANTFRQILDIARLRPQDVSPTAVNDANAFFQNNPGLRIDVGGITVISNKADS